jgi:hypothetical protein
MEELLKIIGQFLGLVEPDSHKNGKNVARNVVADAHARQIGMPESNGAVSPFKTLRARRRIGRL